MPVNQTLINALVESASLDELKTFRSQLLSRRLSGVYSSTFMNQQITFSSASAMDDAIQMIQAAIEAADGRGAPTPIRRIKNGFRHSPYPHR